MDKPPLWAKLWQWMLLRAEWRSGQKLQRGQFHTSIREMREAMSWLVGYRREYPTPKELRRAYEGFAKGGMVGITKGTRGMLITIKNYTIYQNPKNYEGHNEGHNEKYTDGTLGAQDSKEGKNLRKTSPNTPQLGAGALQRSITGETPPALAPAPPQDSPTATDAPLQRRRRRDEIRGAYSEDFEQAWKAYPLKKDKGTAWQAWQKALKILPPIDDLVNRIQRRTLASDWQKDNGKYIKHMATWLNADGWNDEECLPYLDNSDALLDDDPTSYDFPKPPRKSNG